MPTFRGCHEGRFPPVIDKLIVSYVELKLGHQLILFFHFIVILFDLFRFKLATVKIKIFCHFLQYLHVCVETFCYREYYFINMADGKEKYRGRPCTNLRYKKLLTEPVHGVRMVCLHSIESKWLPNEPSLTRPASLVEQ